MGGRWLRWFGLIMRQYWSLLWPMFPGVGLFVIVAAGAAVLFKNNSAAVGTAVLLAMLFVVAGIVQDAGGFRERRLS